MTAVFADTFFWIALADSKDRAHRRALAFATEWNSPIVTTDEVLVEYLTFFATAYERIRRKAIAHARRILDQPGIRVIPQSRDGIRYFPAWLFTNLARTKNTASQTAFRCKRCDVKG